MAQLDLAPAMPAGDVPEWSGSTWIGAIDIDQSLADGVHLVDSVGDTQARLIVRSGRHPIGFVELGVENSSLDTVALRSAIANLPPVETNSSPVPLPPISIVLCTRDRPEALASAIGSLLQLDYPEFEIVIVDNASATDASRQVVGTFDDPRVRLVSEPAPGLARARNTGVLEARHPIVAFTDDDVVVDRFWLQGMADGFNVAADVACVCGIVPSGELRSFSQAYFDSRVTWARSCTPKIYRLSAPPEDQPLFPFQVGQYGTGANFGMRRSVILQLGGFDEALGVGSPTRGGEDIDVFVRTLLAGYALEYQPTALVWHRHRVDMASLHEQLSGYGLGLGAWIAKLMSDRKTAAMVLRRAGRGVLHTRKMTKVDIGAPPSQAGGAGLASIEIRAMAKGPLAYLRARRGGASKAPLLNRS